jgi:hypothetical protein
MNIYLIFAIFVSGLIFIKPCNADMQSLLDNLKSHNSQIIGLKNKKGLHDITLASERLNSVQFICKINRRACSNQIAKNEVK